MSKTGMKMTRRDGGILDDHIHNLPEGGKTGGKLGKPSQSTQFPIHTHLYEHEGKVHETGPAMDEPGHTHETMIDNGAKTGGPLNPPAKTSFGPRNDSAIRIGADWVVRNDSGEIIAKGSSALEAERKAKAYAS